MIEKLASSILTKYLGRYVEGLEEKNLQISLLKGSVQLSHLKLRKEALDGLELPITVKTGYLEELELVIPWKNLKFEQASLRIKKIYLEAGPKEQDELSGEEKVIATKQRILQLAELVGVDDVSTDEQENVPINTKANASFLETIVSNVVNNIQLFLDDVYVRYVEKDLGFDFGMRFQSLHAQSTDFFWQPKIITQNDVKDKFYYKLIQLKQFSLFWNSNSFNYSKNGDGEFENILSPVDVSVHLIINKNDVLETSQPKLSIECTIPFIEVNFNENQYKELLFIIETFSNYRKSMNYLHLRPSVGYPRDHAISWWKYAYDSTLFDLKKKKQRTSWNHILQLIREKKRYILLFAKKKVLDSEKLILSKEEQKELDQMEYQYDVEVIINWRNLSAIFYKQLKDERKKKKEELMKKKWFGMFNPGAPLPFDLTLLTANDLLNIESQLQATVKTQSQITPKNYIQYKIDFTLQKSEIIIRDHYLSKIMSFNCSYLAFDSLLRSGGGRFSLFVQSFNILDHHTLNTFLPQILFSRDIESHSEPIIRTSLDLNPLDKAVDIDLEVVLSSVILVFPKQLLLRTFQFFALPIFERQSRSLELLAIEKLQEFKNQATKQIKDLFNNEKRIALSFKIPSPKLLIPQNIQSSSSSLLIIDLGSISFQNSELELSPSNMDSIYSLYLLSLTDINAYFTNIESFLSDIRPTESKPLISPMHKQYFRFIENFTLQSKIEICRFQSPIFPLFRINASLNSFFATISESSCTTLLLLFDEFLSTYQTIDKSMITIEEVKLLQEISNIKAQQMEVHFTIGLVELKIQEDYQHKDILKVKWNNFSYNISQSNHATSFEATLSSAYVIDCLSENQVSYLFTSEIRESGASMKMINTLINLKGQDDCMISIKYQGIPEKSPLFQTTRHHVVIEFNSIHFFTNLNTVERLVLFLDKTFSKFFELRTPLELPSIADFESLEIETSNSAIPLTSTSSPTTDVCDHHGNQFVNMQIILHSVGFTIPLHLNVPLVEGIFGRSELTTIMYPSGDFQSFGKIGKATIDYKEASDHGFPHILEIEGDNLVKFEIFKTENPNKRLSSNSAVPIDYNVKVEVDSMRFYYFHSLFITLHHHLTSIRTQKYNLRSSTASQPSLSSNIPTLILYDITVQNPQIIFPTICSDFVEGMSVNLGVISLKNKIYFASTDQLTSVEEDPLKEEIRLDCKNFFLEEYYSPGFMEAYNEHIIENTNVLIVVNKNYKESDEENIWNINATIPSFSTNITRYRISILKHILQTNFLKSYQKYFHRIQIEQKKENQNHHHNDENKNDDDDVDNEEFDEEDSKIIAELENKLRGFSLNIRCEIEKSTIKMSNGDGVRAARIFSESSRQSYDDNMKDKPVSLLLIQASKTVFSFTAKHERMNFQILTNHFTFDDIRFPDQKHFTKICSPIITNLISKENVIQSSLDDLFKDQFTLKFSSGKNEPHFFDITIENHFVVVMDAWIDVFSFVLQVLPEISSIISNIANILDPNDANPPIPLKINVRFPKPDMCVIHDPTSANSDAFILRTALNLEWLIEPHIKSTQLKIILSETEIFKSSMNSISNLKSLIEQTNIEIMLHEVEETSIIYSLSVSAPIHIRVSFRDYVLIQSLFRKWAPLLTHLTLIRTSTNKLTQHENNIIVLPKQTLLQRFDIACIGGTILFINDLDIHEHEKPLISVVIEAFRLNILNWEELESLEMHLNSVLKIDYLNYKLEVWESMIESTKLSFDLTPDPNTTHNITGNVESVNLNITCSLIDALLNTFQAISSFNSEKSIDHSFYYSGINSLNSELPVIAIPNDKNNNNNDNENNLSNNNNNNLKYSPLLKQSSSFSSFSSPSPTILPPPNEEEEIERKIYPYYLRNDSGVKLIYGITDNPIAHPTNVYYIQSNFETPILYNDENSSNSENNHYNNYHSSTTEKHHTLLKLAEVRNDSELAFTDRIPIDKVGRYKTRIGEKEHFYVTTCEVSYRKGSKLITVRSNRLFINSSYNPIFICLKSVDREDLIYKIDHGQTASIPITYINKYSEFCITTNIDSHNFTKPVSFSWTKELYYLTTNPKSNRSTPSYLIMKYYKLDCDHIFEIFPSLVLINALPKPLNIAMYDPNLNDAKKRAYSVSSQSTLSLHDVALNIDRDINLFFELEPYGRSSYPLILSISFSNRASEQTIQFNNNGISLRASYSTKDHIRSIVIYSEYWLINKSSLKLCYTFAGKNEYLPGQYVNKQLCSSEFLLFSPSNRFLQFQTPNIAVKLLQSSSSTPSSSSSEGFSIESEGLNTPLSIIDDQKQYELIASVRNAPNFFWRTKEITISPKYILVNQTLDTLYYSQVDHQKIMKLENNSYTPLHWYNVNSPKQLCIKFSDFDQEWSSPFNLLINNFSIKVRSKVNNSQYLLYSVSISLDSKGLSTVISISYQVSPEYLIKNDTPFTFHYFQKNSPFIESVKPNQTTSFTLDFIHDFQTLCLSTDDDNKSNLLEVPLDQFSFIDNKFEFLQSDEKSSIFWNFILGNEGNAKILHLKSNPSPDITKPLASITLQIQCISISLIDERPQEIALISLNNIHTNAEIIADQINFDVSVQCFQIDNQLPNSPFPVFLHSLSPKYDNFFHVIGSLRKDSKSLMYFHSFQVFLQPIDIKLDEEIIVRLLDFSKTITLYLEKRNKVIYCEDEFKEIANTTKSQPKLLLIHFNSFKISSLEMSVSFKTDAASVDEEFNRLLPTYLRLLVNFENSSVTFDELYTTRITCHLFELFSKLSSYYTISLKSKLYTLLSSDLIGNPMTLVSNIGVGFYDFFHEPTYAIAKSPANIGTGLARGTKSLVLNSIYAISNTTSKLSGSLASGVATASFDDEFQRERDWSKYREKPQHIGEGAAQGILSLGKGIFQGITGVITEPIKGGSQEGTSGVLKGIVKGTTGLLVKPAVGVLDGVSKLSEGVKNNTSIEFIPTRARLPRYFGRDKVLRPFDHDQAFHQNLLRTVRSGRYSKEFLQTYYPVNDGSEILMVTEVFMLFISKKQNYVIHEISIKTVRAIALADDFSIQITILNNGKDLHTLTFQPFFPSIISQNVKKYECTEICNQLLSLISLLKFNLEV